MQDKNIILVGFGGAGKTIIGRYLAERLGKKFFDIDEEIVKEIGYHQDIYIQEKGWEEFRSIEQSVVNQIVQNKGVIISTGGGTLLTETNRTSLSQSGIVFYLKTTPEELYKRIQLRIDRPIAKGWTFEEMKEKFNEREPFYNKADVIVDIEAMFPFEASDKVLDAIYKKGFTLLPYEFWFRSTYKVLLQARHLSSFIRPGNRLYPEPKSVREHEEALVRILLEPGTTESLPKLDEWSTRVQIETVLVKKIKALVPEDFIGASPDASSPEAVLNQLGLIYNRVFSPEEEITTYKIKYLL